jgi:hypothetical protein
MADSIGSGSFWGKPAHAAIGVAAVVLLLVAAIAGGMLLGGSPAATPGPGNSEIAAVTTPTASPSGPAASAPTASPETTPTAAASSPGGSSPTTSTTAAAGSATAGHTAPPPHDTATPVTDPCAAPDAMTGSATAGFSAAGAAAPIAAPNQAAFAAIASGHFGRAGAFPAGGGYDTATRLAGGKVLLVGGGTFGDRAEIYDPTLDTFKSTGSLVRPRRNPLAALAANGKVLIVGGGPAAGCVDFFIGDVELYDPGTGRFTSLGTPLPGANYNALTRLSDGRILISGGDVLDEDGETSHSSSVIYNSAAVAGHPHGTFTPTAATIPTAFGQTATLLGDGRVLFAGGDAGPGPATSAGLYDPVADTFAVTGPMHVARENATATLLPGNRGILIAGGDDGSSALLTAEVFDPSTGTFELTPSPMKAARAGAAAALLVSGKVLIVDGRPYDSTNADRASAELYDPQTGHFTVTGSLTSARDGPLTATLLANGRVLVMWGGSADLYQP